MVVVVVVVVMVVEAVVVVVVEAVVSSSWCGDSTNGSEKPHGEFIYALCTEKKNVYYNLKI